MSRCNIHHRCVTLQFYAIPEQQTTDFGYENAFLPKAFNDPVPLLGLQNISNPPRPRWEDPDLIEPRFEDDSIASARSSGHKIPKDSQ